MTMTEIETRESAANSDALESGADRKSRERMRAIYLLRKAGPECLVAGEMQRPSPKEREVLVKVHATAVMPAEFEWFSTFNRPFGEPRPFPIVLSHELSGVGVKSDPANESTQSRRPPRKP